MTEQLSPKRWASNITELLDCVYGSGPDRFPVKVEELAKDYSRQRFPNDPVTLVQGATLPGFDGALYRAPKGKKGWGIIYNKAVKSPGRINFTLAHEFGHYLLHREDRSEDVKCCQQEMVQWDSEYSQIERQANEFATTLLMPLGDFCRQINLRVKPTLEDIGYCADRYGVSLIAATLRWLEYTKCRSILVLSRDGFILWARSSSPAFKTSAFFRTTNKSPIPIPLASLPMRPNHIKNSKVSVNHDEGVWFKDPCEEISLISDQYDFAISLLHLGDAPTNYDLDGEDGEEDIYDHTVKRTPGSSWHI